MKTKVILEMGCNHNGSMKNAKLMINDAKGLDAWGVKFQKRDIDSIPEKIRRKKRDPKTSFGKTYGEHRRALEFNVNQIKELKEYAEKQGLRFIMSAFDKESVYAMINLGVEYIKLPSQLSSDAKLIRAIQIAKDKKQKLILSTGMHTLDEIKKGILIHCPDILMYCRSIYPCQLNQVHYAGLKKISDNLEAYYPNTKMGYSSHDIIGQGIPLAVVLGAEYIERHYTLDKEMKGFDHGTVSSDFKEMGRILYGIKSAENYMNPFDFENDLLDQEKKVRLFHRGF